MKLVIVTTAEKLERNGITYKLDAYRTFGKNTVVYDCTKLNTGKVGFVGKCNGHFGPICALPETAFRRARQVAAHKSKMMKTCNLIKNSFTRSK